MQELLAYPELETLRSSVSRDLKMMLPIPWESAENLVALKAPTTTVDSGELTAKDSNLFSGSVTAETTPTKLQTPAPFSLLQPRILQDFYWKKGIVWLELKVGPKRPLQNVAECTCSTKNTAGLFLLLTQDKHAAL